MNAPQVPDFLSIPGGSCSVSNSVSKAWLLTSVCGLGIGLALGFGMIASHTHLAWAAAAGVVVGVVGAFAARLHPVRVALGGGVIVVLTSVTLMSLRQWHVGAWSQTNPDMIDHYGTPREAVLRVTLILLVAVCVPCVLSSATTALLKKRRQSN